MRSIIDKILAGSKMEDQIALLEKKITLLLEEIAELKDKNKDVLLENEHLKARNESLREERAALALQNQTLKGKGDVEELFSCYSEVADLIDDVEFWKNRAIEQELSLFKLGILIADAKEIVSGVVQK